MRKGGGGTLIFSNIRRPGPFLGLTFWYFVMTPKDIHKIFIPQKIFIFLKTLKGIEIQNFEPQNGASLRMNENIIVPPPSTLSSQIETGAGGVQTQITEKNSDKGVYCWFFCNYSRTSMARTLMAHSPGLARTIKWSLQVILCIIHPGWLELPLAKTIFHSPKPVPVIEVLLYIIFFYIQKGRNIYRGGGGGGGGGGVQLFIIIFFFFFWGGGGLGGYKSLFL